jgi:hypothetical protein
MDEEFNPFQSPAAPPPSHHASDGTAGRPVPPFASGRVRAVVAMASLGILAMLNLAFIDLYTVQYGLLDRWQHGEQVSRAAHVNYEEWRAVQLADYVVFVLAVVAFLAWVHRAYRNLPALGNPAPSTTPGWAVGFYLMPLLNLFMPCVVMAEIWRYSDPSQAGAVRKSNSPLVGWWWAVLVASEIAWFASLTQSLGGPANPSIDLLKCRTLVVIAVGAGQFISKILQIMLIWKIDRNQQTRHDLIEARSGARVF